MTVKKLLKKLARPVDTINIDSEGEFSIVYDGFETEEIPEGILTLSVKTWEVRVTIRMVSLGEAEILYLLVIEV